MKKYLLAAFCVVAVQAWADDSPIAVIDMQRVMSESTMGMAAKSNLEAALKKKRATLEQQQGEIKQLRASIQKQASILSPEAMNKKLEELKVKERSLQQDIGEYQEEFSMKNSAEVVKLIAKVKEILLDLGEEHGFSAVVEKDQRLVVYSAPEVDFTDELIEELNDSN